MQQACGGDRCRCGCERYGGKTAISGRTREQGKPDDSVFAKVAGTTAATSTAVDGKQASLDPLATIDGPGSKIADSRCFRRSSPS